MFLQGYLVRKDQGRLSKYAAERLDQLEARFGAVDFDVLFVVATFLDTRRS